MTLNVIVNEKHHTVPDDFGSTPEEFLEHCGYTVKEWVVYRVGHLGEGEKATEDDRCSEPLVVGGGDEFLVVPRYIAGG